ncbi:MAG: helix-turn-helix domain-containing protein [Mycobacteriales bacterium]
MSVIADVDVAAVAAVMGDRARAAMLNALLDGSARPAGELARAAGVSPPTASGHLRRLLDARLLAVQSCGRHRYYALSGPPVAAALEALALIAPPLPVRSLRQSRTAAALAEARCCYDHLAGRAGVSVRSALLDSGALEPAGPGDHRLTGNGRTLLDELGIDADRVQGSRRMLARDCMDWTERRPHLAGALPAALLTRFLEMGWFTRRRGDRGLTVTDVGLRQLADLGHAQTPERPAAARVS